MKKTFIIIFLGLIFNKSYSQGLPLPYYTGFDSPAEIAGWYEYRKGDLNALNWAVFPAGFSVPNCLVHNYSPNPGPDSVIDWFVSPPVNFSGPGLLSMKVYRTGFDTPLFFNFEVWFGTGNQDPEIGNFSLIASLSYMSPEFQWLDTLINVPFTTDSGYIALKYTNIGAWDASYAVDNIQLDIDSSVFIKKSLYSINSISINPNPVSTTTLIKIEGLHNYANTEVQILNEIGVIVSKYTYFVDREIIFNRENLPSGMYFVKVAREGRIIATRSFVIE